MTEGSGTAAAGWYPDPGGSQQLRYFDGEIWTEHYHDQAVEQATHASEATVSLGDGFTGGYTPTPSRVSRALSAPGALLSSAFEGVKVCIAPLIGIMVGYMVAVGVLYALFVAWVFRQSDDIDRVSDFGNAVGNLILAFVVFAVLYLLAFSIYVLMTSRVLHQHHTGNTVSLDEAWSKTRTRMWGFMGTIVVLYIGAAIGLAILAAVLASIAEIATLLLLAAMFFLYVKLGFIAIAAVATNRGDSMVTNSTFVSQGRFWPVAGRLLLLALPIIAVYILSIILFAALSASDGISAALVLMVVTFVGLLIAGLVVQSGIVRLYLDAGGRSDL